MNFVKVIAVLVMTATVLSSCQQSGSTTVGHGYKVGTWKTAQTIQPFFYEQFADGQTVEVVPFTNPGDQKTALLAGSLDMTGTTMATAIVGAAAGEPIVVVAGLCNKCSALVVGKDSGIYSERDLRGKTIAYVPGTMHHILLLDVLRRHDIDPDNDVTLVRVDFFDMGLALANGDIDAFLSGEPYPSVAEHEGYGRILSFPYFDEGVGAINAAMITTRDMVENEPERVQALVDMHIASTRYLLETPDAWLETASAFGTDMDVLNISAENIELFYDIDEAFIAQTERLAQEMHLMGVIPHVPDVAALFDLRFIKAGHAR